MRKKRKSNLEFNLMGHLKNLKAQADFAFDVIKDTEGVDTPEMLMCKSQLWSSYGFVHGVCEGLIMLIPDFEEKLEK